MNKASNNPRFVNLEVVTPGVYEIKSLKKSITNDQALQVGLMVYLNAKLHLFQFYYEFMKKFLDPKKYCLIETDTDSILRSIRRKYGSLRQTGVQKRIFYGAIEMDATTCLRRTQTRVYCIQSVRNRVETGSVL